MATEIKILDIYTYPSRTVTAFKSLIITSMKGPSQPCLHPYVKEVDNLSPVKESPDVAVTGSVKTIPIEIL
jgi:hypothetical protein